mgnify:FL=1|tara:strand:+ start:197 stop:397 length:201 start_codon:yes stop_codon:yes gene_type:complete
MSTPHELTIEQQKRQDIMNSFSDDVIRAAEKEIHPFHKSLDTYPLECEGAMSLEELLQDKANKPLL